MTATKIGAAVLSQGSLLPSIVAPSPTRHNYPYKVMEQLREKVSTPTSTTYSKYKKDGYEDHQGDGGRIMVLQRQEEVDGKRTLPPRSC